MKLGLDWIAVVVVAGVVAYTHILPIFMPEIHDGMVTGTVSRPPQPPTQPTPPTPESTCKTRAITKEELTQHATEESMWVVMDGSVMDVSDFYRRHPGGPNLISAFALSSPDNDELYDAWQSFKSSGHSPGAHMILKSFCIGYLVSPHNDDL